MGNEEIIQLRELKEELLNKAIQLRDCLKVQEENGHQLLTNFDIKLPSDDKDKSMEAVSTRYKAKLCEISGQVTGIVFKDVNKKWLRANVYLYTTKVVMKTISFNLELTIFFENSGDFKIDDITCYFIDIDDCYMLEIFPWSQKITNTKNFSLLMSAFSDYNENNILRSKILHSLKSKKYASIEQCTQENGGILLHMHSPADIKKCYVTFQWTMKFLDFTWHIEHFFTVNSVDTGREFSQKNYSLLKEFCNAGLTKYCLLELWDRLCIAIDTYHAKKCGK